jgi:hypothetical protein
MKYQPPLVVILSQSAAAQGAPNACVPGSGVGGYGFCSDGSADATCFAGTSGNDIDNCGFGGEPGFSCVGGAATGWECAGGLNVELQSSCTSGPTII